MKTLHEPRIDYTETTNYVSDVSRAFNWYNQEKDKKDARHYLRSYVGKENSKVIDRVPDSMILGTYGWIARMISNGSKFKEQDLNNLNAYVANLISYKPEVEIVIEEKPAVERPTVRDYLEDKVKEYLGELEGVIDDILFNDATFDLSKDLKARQIPAQYCPYISEWVKRKAGEFIGVYESKDKEFTQAYENFPRRKITQFIKTLSTWLQDIESYSQFKKANRKPRAKKIKPAGTQISKLKFKKEDANYKLRSINPVDIVGASQVWIFNTKYKKLSVYRTDSRDGIQVKGTTLQNYDPEQCEQKTIRKPEELLKKVMDGGKIVLRRILSDVKSANTAVNGRINEDCILLRAIR